MPSDHPREEHHDYDAYVDNDEEDDDNDGGDYDDGDDAGDGWFEVLQPQSKVLACGDRGDGKSEQAPLHTALPYTTPHYTTPRRDARSRPHPYTPALPLQSARGEEKHES